MDRAQKVFEDAVRAEEAGHSSKALRLYEKASITDPEASHARLRWASLLRDEGRWKDAIRVARELIKSRPRLHLAPRLIGDCYAELGRLSMAERYFRRSLAIKQDPITWVLLSDVLGSVGREEESEECLRAALKIDPDYEEAHYNLGCVYKLEGKLTLAEKHLKKAIAIDRKYSLAYAELGHVFLKKGKAKEALKVLKTSVRYGPDYGWSRLYLAIAFWTLRKLTDADEQYRKVIELWPDSSLSYTCYGDFLAYVGKDNSTAEWYLRTAFKMDPRDEMTNYHLGNHLAYWGREQEAKPFLREAARQGHSRAQERLRDIEKGRNRV
jgi:tetratricopeptide (TPR) repeat protein